MKLVAALDIKAGAVVSLVGGGGKTTLMFALARELAAEGHRVITTTTTRIAVPAPGETGLLIVEEAPARLIAALRRQLGKTGHITVAAGQSPPGKLVGVAPELVAEMAALPGVACVIVEADGAAGRPLKAPNRTEPVIPGCSSLVIPVVGIEAAGAPLEGSHVFRPEIAARLLGLEMGEVISAEAIARLVTHPQGMAKGSPGPARIVPFINKVDLPGGMARAREVARCILERKHPRIERVVLGQARRPEPVVAVITA
ncbi:MAG: selenium cofactor biosynthesis protein YqeC [Chloroflexota bacterium]